MTNEFEVWFNENFKKHLWPDQEERDEIKTYTWLAWRDGQRKLSALGGEEVKS